MEGGTTCLVWEELMNHIHACFLGKDALFSLQPTMARKWHPYHSPGPGKGHLESSGWACPILSPWPVVFLTCGNAPIGWVRRNTELDPNLWAPDPVCLLHCNLPTKIDEIGMKTYLAIFVMSYIQLRFLKFTNLGQKMRVGERRKMCQNKAPKENDYSLYKIFPEL